MRANARSILASAALAALASFSVQAQNQDINPRVDTSKPAVDDVNPRVDTSVAPSAETAPVPAPAKATAPKPSSSTPMPKPAIPAGSASSAPSTAAAPAPAKKGGKALDRLELDTTQITGNRELPKVLYIVPWKRADLGDLLGRPVNSLLDEVLTPVDRDVFQRENRYYRALTPAQGAAGAAPADPNGAPQSKAGGNTIPVTGVGPASSGSGDASATPSPGNER